MITRGFLTNTIITRGFRGFLESLAKWGAERVSVTIGFEKKFINRGFEKDCDE